MRANTVLKYNLYLVGLRSQKFSRGLNSFPNLFHKSDLITFPIFNDIIKTVFFR